MYSSIKIPERKPERTRVNEDGTVHISAQRVYNFDSGRDDTEMTNKLALPNLSQVKLKDCANRETIA